MQLSATTDSKAFCQSGAMLILKVSRLHCNYQQLVRLTCERDLLIIIEYVVINLLNILGTINHLPSISHYYSYSPYLVITSYFSFCHLILFVQIIMLMIMLISPANKTYLSRLLTKFISSAPHSSAMLNVLCAQSVIDNGTKSSLVPTTRIGIDDPANCSAS